MDSSSDPQDSNAHLAALLADSYKEADVLRRELAAFRKRAENAEHLLHSIQTVQRTPQDNGGSGGGPQNGTSHETSRLLIEFEDRAVRAERARDEAESRRRAFHENWNQLDRYLTHIELRATDARQSFLRVLSDPAAPPLAFSTVLTHVPPLSSAHAFPPLPPPPNPNPSRRPRTPSMDASFAAQPPPSKRSRGNSDDRSRRYPDQAYPLPTYDDYRLRREPRMIRPPGHRSRSRSSERSISSVDEMLLQATAAESNGTTPNGANPSQLPRSRTTNANANASTSAAAGTSIDDRRPVIHPQNTYPSIQRSHPDSPPYPNRPRGDHNHPGQVQPYQTHVFAPVVTGAPPKKQKYTPGVTPAAPSIGPIETPPVPAPPVAAFPPTNAEGQRICRQCGLPGRYKDGKCVEKWGPGPMGPGTVCDRCRKKMKRVERRGTLEQQLANTSSLGSLASMQQRTAQPAERSLQRSDTVLTTHQSQSQGNTQMSFSRDRAEPGSFRSLVSPGKSARAISPPPAIASLKDEDEPSTSSLSAVAAAAAASSSTTPGMGSIAPITSTASRSSSRNGRPKVLGLAATKRSPLASGSVSGDTKDASPGGRLEADAETDADAEAEVDADAEAEGENEEYEIEDDDDPPPRRKAARDIMSVREAVREADEELLEAVDAAEANSSSSHAGVRRYHDDD